MIDLTGIDWKGGLLIRSTNWLGDTLMSLPASYKISTLVPKDLPLGIVCQNKLKRLWEQVPWVQKIFIFQGKRFDESCQGLLRQFNPGATIIFPNSLGSVLDLYLLGFPNLIGRTGQGRKFYVHHRLPRWKRRPGKDKYHEARKYLEIATSCGFSHWNCQYPALELKLTDSELNGIKSRIDFNEALLIMASGAAYGPSKRWSSENFNRVAQWWSESIGQVVTVGAPGEEAMADLSIANCHRSINLAGKTTLSQLMYVFKKATCVLTNDSGAMHLAAALNTKGVAIFGSTDPIATGPIGGQWIVLRKELFCSPCLKRFCYRKDCPYECLKTISPSMVIEKIKLITDV